MSHREKLVFGSFTASLVACCCVTAVQLISMSQGGVIVRCLVALAVWWWFTATFSLRDSKNAIVRDIAWMTGGLLIATLGDASATKLIWVALAWTTGCAMSVLWRSTAPLVVQTAAVRAENEPQFTEPTAFELPVDELSASLQWPELDAAPAAQSWSREVTAENDRLFAEVSAQFQPGERNIFLHLPFVPIFAAVPQLACETDQLHVVAEVDRVQRYGARLRLRRSRDVQLELQVQLQIEASLDCAARRAA